MTFATSTVWYGIALVLMPSPGGHIPWPSTVSTAKPWRLPAGARGGPPGGAGILRPPGPAAPFRHLYAVGGSERAAKASGINLLRTRLFAFLVSGVFVALAALCMVGQTATGMPAAARASR